MAIHQDKISFLTTVSNFKLYKKTSIFYPPNADRYVIDGREGMYGIQSIIYMMDVLKDKDIDWLIMIDEDGILIDYKNILDLIVYMDEHEYMVCGMQDGGVNPIRHHSPIAINTYFSIIDFKTLKQIWNADEVLNNQYIHKGEFKISKDFIKYEYEAESLFEGYYCFYFWLLRNGYKILYLNAENPIEGDIYSNVLFNHLDKPILYHTWYARVYGKTKMHTKRINHVLTIRKKINNNKSKYIEPTLYKDASVKRNVVKADPIKTIKKKIKNLVKTLFFNE
ncbi:MAG: hypothetical protein KDD03_09560 [Gelidibacter sp.]|nr:hypothetical protein [Gelidibacter sp.]